MEREAWRQRVTVIPGSRLEGHAIAVETELGVLELSVEDSDPVDSISVRALLSSDVAALLRRICSDLGARYYDSEEGDFIEP